MKRALQVAAVIGRARWLSLQRRRGNESQRKDRETHNRQTDTAILRHPPAASRTLLLLAAAWYTFQPPSRFSLVLSLPSKQRHHTHLVRPTPFELRASLFLGRDVDGVGVGHAGATLAAPPLVPWIGHAQIVKLKDTPSVPARLPWRCHASAFS